MTWRCAFPQVSLRMMVAAEDELLLMSDIADISYFLKAEMPNWPPERLQASVPCTALGLHTLTFNSHPDSDLCASPRSNALHAKRF